jgi:VanZ family protein
MFIFLNSSKTGAKSNNISKGIVNRVVTILKESDYLDSNIIDQITQRGLTNSDLNVLVRKSAHATEFFLLAVIVSITCNFTKINRLEAFIYPLFIVLLCAVLDEFFQSYVQGRTSSLIDVLIDFSGGIIGTLISNITFILTRKVRKKFSEVQ